MRVFTRTAILVAAIMSMAVALPASTHAQAGDPPPPVIILQPPDGATRAPSSTAPAPGSGLNLAPFTYGDDCLTSGDPIVVDDGDNTYDITVTPLSGFGTITVLTLITPPYYPYTIGKACMYWRTPQAGAAWDMVIYANNAGTPGAQLAVVSETGMGAAGWYSTPISYTTNSGSVFVGFRYDPNIANLSFATDNIPGSSFQFEYSLTPGWNSLSYALLFRVATDAPAITSLVVTPNPIDEFQTSGVTVNFTDPVVGDSHTYNILWGDGTSASGAITSGNTIGHTFVDDPPSGTTSDVLTITVEVCDQSPLCDTDTTTITVNNVAPAVTASATSPISEGGTTTLSGTITDPGTLDTFTLDVDWGDGSAVETFNYAAGTTTFSETHTYPDDNPTATPSDNYTIGLTLTDDDTGSVTGSTPVTVNNVAPAVTASATSPISEGSATTLSGTISDPGTLDSFTLDVDWGDGSAVETFTYAAGTTTYSETHTYTDATGSPFTISVTLTDDDTGSNTTTTNVTVTSDVLGVGKAFAPTSVGIGETSTMTLTFLNPNGGTDFTSLVFTDNFLANLEPVTTGTASGSCAPSSNSFDVTVGATSVTQSTTTIAAGDTCTVDIDVFSNTAGVYNNTVTGISADPAGAAPDSNTATLTVIDALIFEKEFDDPAIDLDTTTTVVFTLTNLDPSNVATNVFFSDMLPPGLQFKQGTETIVTPTECGVGAVVTWIDKFNLDFTGGEIQPGTACLVSADVIGKQVGNYTNAFETFGSDLPLNDGTDTADLSVAALTPPADTGGATTEDHARAQAPLCADLSGATNPIIRADVPGGTVSNGGVYCRVINANGAYEANHGPAEVGDLSLVNLGILQAVDVFGMAGATPVPAWNSSVEVCLQGSGTFWYLGALDAPRVPTVLPATFEGGYTCAILYNAGTVVLTP